MKKTLIASLAIGAVAVTATAVLAAGGSGIRGTAHDLSATGAGQSYGVDAGTNENDPLNRICIYCHAPHNANKTPSGLNSYSPLWNRPLSTITSFQMYDSGATTPTIGPHTNAGYAEASLSLSFNAAPGGVSMLCLSCHDGSVATNVYGNKKMANDLGGSFVNSDLDSNNNIIESSSPTMTLINIDVTGTEPALYQIGENGDLSNHHPMFFSWDAAAAADPEIATKWTTFDGTATRIADVLYDGDMECVTCHDVHNSQNAASAEKFLWTSNSASNFCCACHLKCDGNARYTLP